MNAYSLFQSITQRAIIISALAEGESDLIDPLISEDTEYLINALNKLGKAYLPIPGQQRNRREISHRVPNTDKLERTVAPAVKDASPPNPGSRRCIE